VSVRALRSLRWMATIGFRPKPNSSRFNADLFYSIPYNKYTLEIKESSAKVQMDA